VIFRQVRSWFYVYVIVRDLSIIFLLKEYRRPLSSPCCQYPSPVSFHGC
jgi:hypothetical protein